MTSRLGSESHRYDFDETSGQLLDKVGSKHSNSINGGLTRTGSSYLLDGVNDYVAFTAANNPLGNVSTDDYSIYMLFRLLNANGNLEGIIGGDSGRFPGWLWNDSSLTNTLAGSANNIGTDNFNMGIAEPESDEYVAMCMSVNASTNQLHVAAETSGGTKVNASLVHSGGSNEPTNRPFYIGRYSTIYGHMEAHQMGTYATAYALTDLQDTVADLIADLASSVDSRRQFLTRGRR